MQQKNSIQGVTLLEVLLVLAISSAILIMVFNFVQQKTQEIRLNRTALQLQQIQNAGLSYFALTNRWPTNLDELQNQGFLSKTQVLQNPWGNTFDIKAGENGSTFYVYTNALSPTNAQVIVGKLPLGFVSDGAGIEQNPPSAGACGTALEAGCIYAVAMSTAPRRNLDNANSVTFANLYHSGACVPEPLCPVGKDGRRMEAEIIVMPVSVNGLSSRNMSPSGVIPISGYTARALPRNARQGNLPACNNTGNAGSVPCEKSSGGPTITTGRHWRVCLKVTSEEGVVVPPTVAAQQETGVILAITRCKPATEIIGSDFNVWSN